MTTSVVRSLFLCLWVTPSTSDTGRLHTKERLRHSGGAWCDPTFGRGVVWSYIRAGRGPTSRMFSQKEPACIITKFNANKKRE